MCAVSAFGKPIALPAAGPAGAAPPDPRRAGGPRESTPLSMAGKATAILAELATAPSSLTLSELARRTGFAKTTTYRLLGTLLEGGLVRRNGTHYRLNDKVSWLVPPADHRISRIRRLRRGLLPHMVGLYETSRQTVNLAVPRDDEVVYVDRIYGRNRVASRSDGVDRAPARLTAAGRLFLAYRPHPGPIAPEPAHGGPVRANGHGLESVLAGIRREGVAYNYGDLTAGVYCVAAPVRDRRGEVIAAVSLAGRAREFDPVRHAPLLRRTAYAMSVVACGTRHG